MSGWPIAPLSDVIVERKERVGVSDGGSIPLLGVSNREGLHRSGMPRIADMSRYLKVEREWFAYNPMRINVGSIGWANSDELLGIISPDYVVFSCRPAIDPGFLYRYLTSAEGLRLINLQTAGSVRDRLYFASLAKVPIPLPPIEIQKQIVTTIETLVGSLQSVDRLQVEVDTMGRSLLLSAYQSAVQTATWYPMSRVAPLVRRPVQIDALKSYPELGIRSFGKGSFHKPPLEGASVGTKKLFRIEAGDLVFNIVFAWEGAVAVARLEDDGRFGSHRFLSCVTDRTLTTPEFLCFHFLTDQGIDQLGKASPGGAGRNRTLGVENLAKITVPIPRIEEQRRFVELLRLFEQRRLLRESIGAEVAALRNSVVARAFNGGFERVKQLT